MKSVRQEIVEALNKALNSPAVAEQQILEVLRILKREQSEQPTEQEMRAERIDGAVSILKACHSYLDNYPDEWSTIEQGMARLRSWLKLAIAKLTGEDDGEPAMVACTWGLPGQDDRCYACHSVMVPCPHQGHPNSSYWEIGHNQDMILKVCPNGCPKED